MARRRVAWRQVAERLVEAIDQDDDDTIMELCLAVREVKDVKSAPTVGRRQKQLRLPQWKRRQTRPIPGPGRRPVGCKRDDGRCLSCLELKNNHRGAYCISCYQRGETNGFCGCGRALFFGGFCSGEHYPGG